MSKARDIADLDFNSPDIDGGNIDGAVIGATTAAAATVSTFTVGDSLFLQPDGNNDLLKSTGGVLYLKANEYSFQNNSGNEWLSFNSSGNATFSGTVDVNGAEVTVGSSGSRFAENNLRFLPSGGAFIDHNTSGQVIQFRTTSASALDRTPLEIGPDQVVVNQNGQQIDFRVETDTKANALLIDASTNQVKTDAEFIHDSDNGNHRFYITRTGATNQSGSMYVDDNNLVFDSTQDETSGANFLFRGTNASASNVNYLHLDYAGGAIFNEGGVARNFRVESNNNSHALFVDGTNDRVGICESAPSVKFHVKGDSNDSPSESTANVQFEGAGGNGLAFGTMAASGLFSSWIQAGYVNDFSTAKYNLALNPLGANVLIGEANNNNGIYGKLNVLAPASTNWGNIAESALNIRQPNNTAYHGQIVFSNFAGGSYGFAAIGCDMTSGSGIGTGDLVFATKASSTDAVATERLKLTHDGKFDFPTSVGTTGVPGNRIRGMTLIGDANSTGYNDDDGNWGSRLQVASTIHAKINVSQQTNAMKSHWFAHTGQDSIKFGTESLHDVEFQCGNSSLLELSYNGGNRRVDFHTNRIKFTNTAGGEFEFRTGGRNGTGTYTLFTNGSTVTQSMGIVEIMAIYGTPSSGGYRRYKITGDRGVYLIEDQLSGYGGGGNPTLAWNGADLQVSNSNGSVYYHVSVFLPDIGNGWSPTWGNLPGIN